MKVDESKLSLDTLYLYHMLETIDKMQGFLAQKDASQFSLHCAFLRSKIPDDEIYNDLIEAEIEETKRQQKLGTDERLIPFHAGFKTVRGVMKYLNRALGITKEDITGALGDLDLDDDGGEPADDPVVPAQTGV